MTHPPRVRYFPPGHHEFFADAISHPDMLQLQGMLFGGAPFQFDHAQILTREPGEQSYLTLPQSSQSSKSPHLILAYSSLHLVTGYRGHPWHSHFNGDASDNAGTCTDPGQYGSQQRNLIFLFIYPDGVGPGDADVSTQAICRCL